MKQAFFSVIVVTIAGAGLGHLAKLKGLGESTSWWLLGGAALCLILAVLLKFSDMEGDFEEKTAKAMAYLGFAGVCLSAAAFSLMWFQDVGPFKFAGTVTVYVLAIVASLYHFKEVFLEK